LDFSSNNLASKICKVAFRNFKVLVNYLTFLELLSKFLFRICVYWSKIFVWVFLKLYSIVCSNLLSVRFWSNIIFHCSLDIVRSNIIQIYLLRSVFKLKCNMMQYSQRKLYKYKLFWRTLVIFYYQNCI